MDLAHQRGAQVVRSTIKSSVALKLVIKKKIDQQFFMRLTLSFLAGPLSLCEAILKQYKIKKTKANVFK